MTTNFDEAACNLATAIENAGPYPLARAIICDTALRSMYDAGRASALPPEGSILTADGVVRRYDFGNDREGKPIPLPILGDGSLWAMNEELWTIDVDNDDHKGTGEVVSIYHDEKLSWTQSGWVVGWGEGEIQLSKCYSTKESAELARAGGGATSFDPRPDGPFTSGTGYGGEQQ
jgi:hypothetical protein